MSKPVMRTMLQKCRCATAGIVASKRFPGVYWRPVRRTAKTRTAEPATLRATEARRRQAARPEKPAGSYAPGVVALRKRQNIPDTSAAEARALQSVARGRNYIYSALADVKQRFNRPLNTVLRERESRSAVRGASNSVEPLRPYDAGISALRKRYGISPEVGR